MLTRKHIDDYLRYGHTPHNFAPSAFYPLSPGRPPIGITEDQTAIDAGGITQTLLDDHNFKIIDSINANIADKVPNFNQDEWFVNRDTFSNSPFVHFMAIRKNYTTTH